MPMQLTLDLATKPQLQSQPIIQNAGWLDVSDIARGVGFTTAVQISIALRDRLEPLHSETDGDYDQRLFDALWLAHFQLSLDSLPSATFNFALPRRDRKTEKISEDSLRMRVEVQQQIMLLGLLEDF